jgi:hypothetical protein
MTVRGTLRDGINSYSRSTGGIYPTAVMVLKPLGEDAKESVSHQPGKARWGTGPSGQIATLSPCGRCKRQLRFRRLAALSDVKVRRTLHLDPPIVRPEVARHQACHPTMCAHARALSGVHRQMADCV